MLYQACLDPWAVFSIPLYLVMPFNQLIVYTCDALIISNETMAAEHAAADEAAWINQQIKLNQENGIEEERMRNRSRMHVATRHYQRRRWERGARVWRWRERKG